MKSRNPYSGVYKADTTRTLDNNGGNPGCNQGGMIVIEGNGSRDSHRGDGYSVSETMYTLNSVERHAVAVDVRNFTEVGGAINGPLQSKASNNVNSNNVVREVK